MKTECELNGKILLKIQEIQESYPELSTFLGEMRTYGEDVDSQKVRRDFSGNLQAYYDSLDALLASYQVSIQNI